MQVIGFTGPIGSGKTEAAKILRARGYKYFSLTEGVLAALVEEDPAKEVTREAKQDMGDRMRLTHGNDYWARVAADRISETLQEGDANIVIDAIFNPAEIVYLKRRFAGIVIVGVNADWEVREERVIKRKLASDPTTDVGKLREALRRDMGIDQPINGQQVEMCLKLADITIINDTDYPDENDMRRELETKLDTTLAGLGEGARDPMERK